MKDLFTKVINNSTAVAVLLGAAMISGTVLVSLPKIAEFNKQASDYTCNALFPAPGSASNVSIVKVCSITSPAGTENDCVNHYTKVAGMLIQKKDCSNVN